MMEERQVSIDGVTHKMGDFYTILATQNPVEQEGTYRLPEAQLDRFLMKITMGYPSLDDELEILKRHQEHSNLVKLADIQPVLSKAELLQLRSYINKVVIDESLLRYIAQIVQQTRSTRLRRGFPDRCGAPREHRPELLWQCSRLARHTLCCKVAIL